MEPDEEGAPTSKELLLQLTMTILEPEFDPRTWQAFWELAVKRRATKEIGKDLKMTVNAVRQAKLRVARKLRQLLDEEFTGIFGSVEGE